MLLGRNEFLQLEVEMSIKLLTTRLATSRPKDLRPLAGSIRSKPHACKDLVNRLSGGQIDIRQHRFDLCRQAGPTV